MFVSGPPWESVLVETGVFKRAGAAVNDPVDPARFVCRGVLDAVDVIRAAAEQK